MSECPKHGPYSTPHCRECDLDIIANVESEEPTMPSEMVERWPGYNEQSWRERFEELDRRYRKIVLTIVLAPILFALWVGAMAAVIWLVFHPGVILGGFIAFGMIAWAWIIVNEWGTQANDQ